MVGIWHALRKNDDFMMLFADRVFQHCFGDGALTDANSIARWRTLNAFIEDAVAAESARWGDARSSLGEPTRTRDDTFYPDVERVIGMMTGSVSRLVAALRREGYYPQLDPPEIEHVGPRLFGQSSIRLQNPNERGQVVYTLAGGDPRQSGGATVPEARTAKAPEDLPITAPFTHIKARVKDGEEWSALMEITLCPKGFWSNLWSVLSKGQDANIVKCSPGM